MHYGFSVSVYTCIYLHMYEHVDVQHGCQAPERPNQSSATHSDQLTCSQSKQTWRRSGRHHYAAQRAVCPDPVWGPLLSADSNELPWVPFYRRPASWGWGREGRGWHQYTHTNICTQTRGGHHISSSQTQIFLNRKRRLGTSAHQSWGSPCGTFLQDPKCTARVSPVVAVTYWTKAHKGTLISKSGKFEGSLIAKPPLDMV